MVVDLDGTLIRGNSLHLFIPFLVRGLMRRRKMVQAVRVGWGCLLRSMRLVSHTYMKHRVHSVGICHLGAQGNVAGMDKYVAKVSELVNRDLLRFIDRRRAEGWKMVLATAAPDVYIPALSRLFRPDAWIATPLSSSVDTYIETRGERKRDLALALADENGWRIAAVVTDHDDDLPLLSIDKVERILVNPTDSLVRSLNEKGLVFEKFEGKQV